MRIQSFWDHLSHIFWDLAAYRWSYCPRIQRRKRRKGTFWEDRYHAAAIESGEHVRRCIVYIDLNMVRAGVVGHPSEWAFSGYREIQEPRMKCALIAYERLRQLSGFDIYNEFRTTHKDWVDESLREGVGGRESK